MIEPVEDRRPPITPQLAVRVAILGAVALALFAVVFFRMWYLQVLSGDRYLAEANDNRVRELRIQAPRGEIVDRNGDVIVANDRATVVEIDPSRLPQSERDMAAEWGRQAGLRERRPRGRKGPPTPIATIPDANLRVRYQRLAGVLGTSANAIHRRVVQSLAVVPYSDVRVRTDVPRSMLAYISERPEEFPGVDVESVYLRDYPRRTLAAQVLGTVGEITPKQLRRQRFRGVKQGTIIGQEGLEYEYDRYLRGTDGIRRVQVDALGRPKGSLREVPTRSGQQLRLSLDLSLQKAGQAALSDKRTNPYGTPASFVAMDPRNGEVLAMGSYPSFNPEVLTRPLTQRRLETLFGEQAGAPRYNRAANGLYPTGSTFKPITATAALQGGAVGVDEPISDPGCITIGAAGQEFCNAGEVSNGPVALRRALQVSSDVYFYRLGERMNPIRGQLLQKWARRLGVGRDTGIDLPAQEQGLVPDREWRARVGRRELRCRKRRSVPSCGISDARPWSVGDNVNLAVGQGDVQSNPLQMAIAYAAIANGGKVVRPHLGLEIEDGQGRPLQRIERSSARRVKLNEPGRLAIMEGLRLAAQAPGGTSYDVFGGWPHAQFPVFGKTGTAEREPKRDQSWYVAYVPNKAKPIVVAATVEEGGWGAEAAAPIVRLVLSEWFDVERKLVKGASRTR